MTKKYFPIMESSVTSEVSSGLSAPFKTMTATITNNSLIFGEGSRTEKEAEATGKRFDGRSRYVEGSKVTYRFLGLVSCFSVASRYFKPQYM